MLVSLVWQSCPSLNTKVSVGTPNWCLKSQSEHLPLDGGEKERVKQKQASSARHPPLRPLPSREGRSAFVVCICFFAYVQPPMCFADVSGSGSDRHPKLDLGSEWMSKRVRHDNDGL
jgi:hypothetical protein